MALDLTGCRAKMDRANECLADFHTSCQAWIKDEADKIVHDNRPDIRQYRIICKKAPVAPPRLTILVGDTVHCFRSCLDFLIYAVAAHESNEEPPPNANRLAFPVVQTNEADFDAKWADRLQYLSVEARAIIENLQPFRESPIVPPDEVNWLWALDKLNNIYKHRRLGVIAMQPGGEVTVGPSHPGLAITSITPPGPLKDDAILLDCRTDGNPDMKVEYNSTFDVGFNEPEVLPGHLDVANTLVTMGTNVWSLVNRLKAIC